MAVQETPITVNDEARLKEIEEAKQRAHDAEIAQAKAEAALDEQRKIHLTQSAPTAQQPAAFTEEQWAKMETETGLTRQQLIAAGSLADQIAEIKVKSLRDEIKKAKEEAEVARKDLDSYRKGNAGEREKEDFFKKNPAYDSYRKEIDEFIDDFPEVDRNDPVKLKRILGRAHTYVKGLAGGKVKPNTDGSFSSARLGRENLDESVEEGFEEANVSDLETRDQRLFVSDLHHRFQTNEDAKKLYKAHETANGMGVRVKASDEFEAVEKEQAKNRMRNI